MAKASSFSPLQLCSPIMLIFCMILFFLPWVELQCAMPAAEVKKMPKEELEFAKKEMGFDPTKPIGMYSQSGLQVAQGGVSLSSDMKKMANMKGGGSNSPKDDDINSKLKKEDSIAAPLMFLYPVAVIGGIVLGFLPWASMTRKIIVAGCCALAFGVVGIQAMIGFPLETKIKEKMKSESGGMSKMPGMGGGGGGGDKDSKSKETDMLRLAWKLPLYLSFLLLLGAGGTAFLGASGGGAKGRKKAYNFDDDDDDDDDDRPRKKKRRDDDDDDEDDRPKKKKAMSLDDEDDRPKKNRRDEDDEDDDRPRKKRRDEDDEPPPKKKRRDEDDEDAPPPKKKLAAPMPASFEPPAPPAPKPAAPAAPAGGNPFAFDDGDDAPPKKKPKRRDEDDEDDDRPRKKKRRDDDD